MSLLQVAPFKCSGVVKGVCPAVLASMLLDIGVKVRTEAFAFGCELQHDFDGLLVTTVAGEGPAGEEEKAGGLRDPGG